MAAFFTFFQHNALGGAPACCGILNIPSRALHGNYTWWHNCAVNKVFCGKKARSYQMFSIANKWAVAFFSWCLASNAVIRVALEFRSKRRIWKCEECHFAAFNFAFSNATILGHWPLEWRFVLRDFHFSAFLYSIKSVSQIEWWISKIKISQNIRQTNFHLIEYSLYDRVICILCQF